MYVASTRARDELYLSYPIYMFDRAMGYVMGRVSRFLEDRMYNRPLAIRRGALDLAKLPEIPIGDARDLFHMLLPGLRREALGELRNLLTHIFLRNV